MLTINSVNYSDVYFNPTFKYGIIFITEYLNIKFKLTSLDSFISSGFKSLKCFVSLMCFLFILPRFSAFMKRAYLRTFRIAHQEPG